MIQYAHVARNNFVIQNGTSRYIDTITMISNYNDGTLKIYKKKTFNENIT